MSFCDSSSCPETKTNILKWPNLRADTYVDFRAREVPKEEVYIKLYVVSDSESLLYMWKVHESLNDLISINPQSLSIE